MSTVYLLIPKTDTAKQWLDDNVQAESWQWLGNGLGIEHRYIGQIWQGICEAGLQNEFDLIE